MEERYNWAGNKSPISPAPRYHTDDEIRETIAIINSISILKTVTTNYLGKKKQKKIINLDLIPIRVANKGLFALIKPMSYLASYQINIARYYSSGQRY